MKFTKEQVLEGIRAHVGNNSQMSDRSINETIDTLLVFVGDDVELNDFLDKLKPVFSSFDGNLRKDVADVLKSVKKEDAQPPKPTPKEDDTKETASGEPAWFRAYREHSETQLNALKSDIENAKAQKTIETLRESVLKKAKDLYPENVINSALLNFDFGKDNPETDFTNVCAEISKNFGIKPVSGGETKPAKPDFSALVNELKVDGVLESDAK